MRTDHQPEVTRLLRGEHGGSTRPFKENLERPFHLRDSPRSGRFYHDLKWSKAAI